MRRLLTHPLYLIALATLFAVLVEFSWLYLLRPLENRLSDFFVRTHARSLQADPDIVIVDIDESSLARMIDIGGSWPWPRSVHGELVAGIAQQQPKAIVFDILFSEPDKFRPESDAFFNEAIRGLNNLYFPMLRMDPAGDRYGTPLASIGKAMGMAPGPQTDPQVTANLLLPKAVVPESWRIGIINFLEDKDGVGRRYYVHLPFRGWKIPSLPARVARDLGYPLPDRENILLGWRGAAFSHTRISYADLYADFSRAKRQRDPRELKGKIVVIGTSASGLHDIRATPIDSLHLGLEILATAIDNLKNNGYMEEAPPLLGALLSVLLAGMLLAAFRQGIHPLKIGAALLPLTAALLAISYALLTRRYLLPVFRPIVFAWFFYFAAALHEYLRERAARQQAIQMFSRFVNPHVVKELVAHGGLSRAGESRQITLLFSDIRGFTTLSETRTPQEVVTLLNRYFSMQVEVIFGHGGSLDKFIGDAIMAFWGAPLDDPRHAEHAIRAALDMSERLDAFKKEKELGDLGNSFDVGIGIHSGPAVVGLIGSEQRREYTAIGDTVNLASRIEGLTKGIARILVSEDTVRLCQDAFDFIDRGSYKVKGRTQEVRLFEPRRKAT